MRIFAILFKNTLLAYEIAWPKNSWSFQVVYLSNLESFNLSNIKSFIFVVAGLSLLEYPGLKAIDPAYALPVDFVNRILFGN
jgi:hypothetical protein